MIEIAVNNLAAATGARTVTGEADRVCRGCVIDSRQVEEGTIFVAFPGENVDGNDFASRAVQSGAGAVVMTREPEAELVSLAQDKGCAILLTDDPEEFLLRLAHTYRLELGCLVVGITGSIGKTTTKDVLAAVLAKRYRVWATKGNFNNLIGMPLTVLSAPADTEVLVLEMGMNHFHEIERLSQSANPNLAIVSKIGTSHIGIWVAARTSPALRPRLSRVCAPPATSCRCWFWAARTTLRRSFAIRSPSLLVST